MLTRFDTAPITSVKTDPDTGFIHATNIPIARVGVFPYLKGDGSIEMEAKLPDQLLADSTVQSANGRPVTDDHPENAQGQRILVDKNNARDLMKGFTASNAHVDKATGTVRVDMTITDGALIDKINKGKRELSIGFQTDVVPVKGTYHGTAYDSVQKNIDINHVAVVQRGRAGHSVALMGDSAEMIEDSVQKGRNMETEKVRTSKGTLTVATDDADKVIKLDADNQSNQQQIASLKQQIAKLQSQLDALQGKNDANSQDAGKAQAKADSLEKELADMKKKYEGDAFDKAVADRINLINTVKPFLGDSFDAKGKTAKDLKVAAIKARNDSIDLDGKSDDYVDAYFDSMVNDSKKSGVVGVTKKDLKADSKDSVAAMRNNLYHLANKGGNN